MQEQELKICPLTKYLKVIEEDHPEAEIYLKPANADRFAEVTAMHRFHDLLHRDEFRPVAVIRFHRHGESFVRVYFELMHATGIEASPKKLWFSHAPHAMLTGTT